MTIKEMLNNFKLNENGEIDATLVDEIEKSINEQIDEKVKEKAQIIAEEIANEQVETYKNELNEQYEDKFEEYKLMITERFSDFVDSVLDEELSIPDDIKEFARKGQLYSDLIDQLKIRVGIDEGKLDEEARELMKEARDEIVNLRGKLNEMENTNIELKSDIKQMAAALYSREKCDGLTESQKSRALKLLEGLTSKNDIDKKFELIKESLFVEKKEDKTPLNEAKVEEKICVCPKCGKETTITEGACDLYNCADCEDQKLTDKGDSDKKPTEENTQIKEGFDALLETYKENFLKKGW